MKNIIIIILSIIIVIFYFNREDPSTIVKTKTNTITKIDTIIKVIDNTKPHSIKKVYINVPVIPEKTEPITITPTTPIYEDKEVNEYVYKDEIPNGLLTSIIRADNIYDRSISLETYDKTTSTTIENTIVIRQFFYGVNVNTIGRQINDVSFNIHFVNKDKYMLSAGVGYTPIMNNITTNVGLSLKF